MGNLSTKDDDATKSKCLICYSSVDNEGCCCEKCNQIVVHIKSDPNGRNNIQMILNRLSMGKTEYVNNTSASKCVGCKIVPVEIFFNNRCFSCGIDHRLNEISETLNVDLKSIKCYNNLDFKGVQYNETRRFMTVLVENTGY